MRPDLIRVIPGLGDDVWLFVSRAAEPVRKSLFHNGVCGYTGAKAPSRFGWSWRSRNERAGRGIGA